MISTMFAYNSTEFFRGIFEYAWSTYNVLGIYKYPLIFVGIIGYIYLSTRSVMLAVIAILVTLGVYGTTTDIFTNVPQVDQLFAIVTMFGITAFIVALISPRIKR